MNNGTRRGWGVSVTPWPLFTPGKDPVPIVQEAGWSPGPVWTGAENLAPTRIRSPDRPARSQSLYRLSYPAHNWNQRQYLNYGNCSLSWLNNWCVLGVSGRQEDRIPVKIYRHLDNLSWQGAWFEIRYSALDDWLTVHRSVALVDFQLDAQNSYLFTHNTFIKILYMFRALPCSSSGGLCRNCIYAASGIVTHCRWLSCVPIKKELFRNRCTRQSPAESDDTRGCIYTIMT